MPVACHEPVTDFGNVPDEGQPHEDGEHRPSTPTLTQDRGHCSRTARDAAIGADAVHRRGGGSFGDAVCRQISALERLEPYVAAA